MKKKLLFVITPLLLLAVTGCKEKSNVASLEVTPKEESYRVGNTFTKDCLNVAATLKDTGIVKDLTPEEYTLTPDSYKFVDADIEKGKDFTVTYSGFSKNVHVNVIEGIKITEITITNSERNVYVDDKLELTASILPETASNKDLEWTILSGGSGSGEIVLENNKAYLKGKTAGEVAVQAKATDGSKVMSDAVDFTVIAPVKVTSVTISNTTKSVPSNGKLELTANVLPETASNKKLNWKIVDGGTGGAEIVTEDNKVYLKGKSEGTVKVQAEASDGSGIKSSVVDFTVTGAAKLVTKITITDTCVNLPLDTVTQLNATVEPEDAGNKNLQWEIVSGGTGDAWIWKDSGQVKGTKDGTVLIRAVAKDGSGIASPTVEFQVSTLQYEITDGTEVTVYAPHPGGEDWAPSGYITDIDIPGEVDGKLVKNGVPGTKYSVTSVKSKGFYKMALLKSIKFPSTMKKVCSEAFHINATIGNVTSITLNEGLEEIGDKAFRCVGDVTSLTLPSTLKTLGEQALCDLAITKITFPASLTTIGKWPFGCNYYKDRGYSILTDITFEDMTHSWTYKDPDKLTDKTFTPSTPSVNAKFFVYYPNTNYGLTKNVS